MKRILSYTFWCIVGFCFGSVFIIYRCGYILEDKQRRVDKFYSYFNLLDRWMVCKETDHKFNNFFCKNNIQSVAIYGMGKLGKHLKYELDKIGIRIEYVIDEGEKIFYEKEVCYDLQDNLPFVDAVIVTPVNEFEEIKSKIISNNWRLNVISLEEILS